MSNCEMVECVQVNFTNIGENTENWTKWVRIQDGMNSSLILIVITKNRILLVKF